MMGSGYTIHMQKVNFVASYYYMYYIFNVDRYVRYILCILYAYIHIHNKCVLEREKVMG